MALRETADTEGGREKTDAAFKCTSYAPTSDLGSCKDMESPKGPNSSLPT